MSSMEHRNGCTGCDHDPAAYPACWTREQVEDHQQHMADMVRLSLLSDYDRSVDVVKSIEDSIALEHMRHTNELQRLQEKLALAQKAVSHAAMHQGR